jgi:hypothetical protein
VDSSIRYFGCAVGFGFGVLWVTEGLGSAIVCLLLAGLGYAAVFTAERARANGNAIRLPSRTRQAEAVLSPAEEFEPDYDLPAYEPAAPADDATSPLAAEAGYGWPIMENGQMAGSERR